jgi:hypothetical protein
MRPQSGGRGGGGGGRGKPRGGFGGGGRGRGAMRGRPPMGRDNSRGGGSAWKGRDHSHNRPTVPVPEKSIGLPAGGSGRWFESSPEVEGASDKKRKKKTPGKQRCLCWTLKKKTMNSKNGRTST